jgi:hypothetical protein
MVPWIARHRMARCNRLASGKIRIVCIVMGDNMLCNYFRNVAMIRLISSMVNHWRTIMKVILLKVLPFYFWGPL